MSALAKVLAKLKAGGDVAADVGKIGLGAASLGTKKAVKVAKANPKAAAGIAGAVGGAAVAKASEDDEKGSRGGGLAKYLKKKKMEADED